MKKIMLCLLMIFCFAKNHAQYYNTAFGLNGAPLKTALHNIIKNHTVQNWPLWNHFSNTDANVNNKVWDIYSDKPGATPPYIFTFVTNQCGSYTQEADCYNHEHSWPSTFFNDVTPMRTDLHHVYPTDGYVNNKRSNYPFGIVSNTTWPSLNGSKLGTGSTYTGYTDKIFEPIDSFKGDLARTYFYMSTRYENEDNGWGNWAMANGAVLTQDAINLLIQWHHNDPVSKKEIDRNNAVALIQNNRNPFIDYPIFADCIWDNADCISLNTADDFFEKNILFYPNPSIDKIIIESDNTISIFKIVVIDFRGNFIIQNEIVDKHQLKHSISLSEIPSGNYLFLLNTSKGIYKKIISKY